jgi:capsule polysaccharide export protein KpsE/RkpR
MRPTDYPVQGGADAAEAESQSLLEFLLPLAQHWGRLLVLPILAGVIAIGASFLVKPDFQAVAKLLPPQQQQSAAASALASLGALAGLAGNTPRAPADLFVSLMLSDNATNRLIDDFKLIEAYDVDFRWQAREWLLDRTGITVGKKDGLIQIAVIDKDPKRAAELANRYIDELRRLTSVLALTEAQERRVFFEKQLEQTKQGLTSAQAALQASGFSVGALKAEPKSAAEAYARLRAELTATEVRLQAVRGAFTEAAPEVRGLQETAAALRGQLARLELAREATDPSADYVSRYREFKYQETLFEMISKQYELARVDESREGALIQVVDVATPPERKLKPKRSVWGITTTLVAFVLLAAWYLARAAIRRAEREDPQAHARWRAFLNALGWRSSR